MTPLEKIERSVATNMEHRLTLMQQSSDFFRPYCDGRAPSLAEKARCVEQMVQRLTSICTYENDNYHVDVRLHPPFIHLDIMRHDGGDCKNWRELQQIKNEIVGPEHEAVELFPAESRLVDTANQYHLWVHVSSDFRFPFGFAERMVLSEPLRYERYTLSDNVASASERRVANQVA